jgi:hypothetical protein
MAVSGIMNLPHYLGAIKGGAKVKLLGVLAGEVDPPEPFKGWGVSTRQDAFAVVDLVGVHALSGLYYVRGRVLTVLPRRLIESAKEKSSGRIALALSGPAVKLSNVRNGIQNFVTMMRWVRGNNNQWQFLHADAEPFLSADYPEFYQVITNAYKNNWQFDFPVTIDPEYIDACHEHEFVLINKQEPVERKVKSPSSPPTWGLGKTPDLPPGVTPITHESYAPEVPDHGMGSTAATLFKKSSAAPELGASTGSDMETLVQNRSVSNMEAKLEARSRIESRDSLAPEGKNVPYIREQIAEADTKVDKAIYELKKYTRMGGGMQDALEHTADAIKYSWGVKTGYITGRALFKEAIERQLEAYNVLSSTGETIIMDNINILGESVVDFWLAYHMEFDENDFLKDLYENRYSIYFKMIELLLGLRVNLGYAMHVCNTDDIDLLSLLKDNPYKLCYLLPSATVEDLDKLAMMYGVDLEDPEVQKVRNVAYMHNYMLDSSNKIVSDNTIVKAVDLTRGVTPGYVFAKRSVDVLQTTGFIVQEDKLLSLRFYMYPDLSQSTFTLPTTGWVKSGFNKMILKGNKTGGDVVKDYIDSGFGVFFDFNGVQWVADYIYAKKEIYVHDRLRELCENGPETNVTKEQLDSFIERFEKSKHRELGLPEDVDYKLEYRQADSVHLITNAVMALTGRAGSGKTTTAEASVDAVEQELGVDPDKILFCAPTGKSANRLQEVTKRKTRTINSTFQIGGESMTLTKPEDVQRRENLEVLIIDETSMPNINIMYEMIIRVPDNCRVIFLGDIQQLAPIGPGKPFANILKFVPTVELNVSKRASNNSGITKNAEAIVNDSDGVIEDLKDYPDYRIVHTKDQDEAVESVLKVVKYHLGKAELNGIRPVENLGSNLSPDDIQVITPINKNVWGTASLNNKLQDIFNPKPFYEKSVILSRTPDDKIEFRNHDRVMHVKANQKDRIRLEKYGQNEFVLSKDKYDQPITGIANGDMGKVVGFWYAPELSFEREENEEHLKILKNEFRGTENVLFIGVEFTGFDTESLLETKFIVLYRAEVLNNATNEIQVISQDLKYLDLAYALTVHKLQGSQARLTILVILPVWGNFISRNMLYTGGTRAKDANYLIGDVYGRDSAVNKGRKIDQMDLRDSLLDFI